MRLGISLAILFLAATAHLSAEFPADRWQESNDRVEVIQPVVYGTGGGRELRMALYVPKRGRGPFPAVVFVHGGGWQGGSAIHFSRQSMILAEAGYTCACIEYRLSGEAPFPAQIEDVKCAVRFLRANAAQYLVDKKRIAVAGGSAGGHLALLAGSSGGVAELEGSGGWQEQSSAVQAAGGFNPATKIEHKGKGSVRKLIGGEYQENPAAYRAAEPETYLDPDDPPVIVMHGTADRIVPYGEAAFYVSKLRSLGITAELYTDFDVDHAWFNEPPYMEQTVNALRMFLDNHLK
ncbi:MAG: alpha/beta hydrolase [Candidatus Glassbacteria bacterium]|nr:alpha/beta hydrolase [Candidatus Glassbacteria bacterium]